MKTLRKTLTSPMILPEAAMIRSMIEKTGYRAAFRYIRDVLGYDKQAAKDLVRQLI